MADKHPKTEPKAAPTGGHGQGHGAQKFTGMNRWFNTYTYRGKTTVDFYFFLSICYITLSISNNSFGFVNVVDCSHVLCVGRRWLHAHQVV